MTKLYVGNLPYSVTDQDLINLFSQFGAVSSATIIVDKMNRNRSKGFGFVEMEDAEAQAAIEKLNGSDMEGRSLVVNVAKPMEDRPKRDFNSNRSGPRSFGGDRDNRGGGFGRSRY